MMKKKQKDRDLESLSKDGLEKQKLKTEIRELERKWWKNPAYLTVLIPIILAISGAFFTYYQTVTSKERIENERLEALLTELMKTQNAYRFESLKTQERVLTKDIRNLSEDNTELINESYQITQENERIKRETQAKLDSAKSKLESINKDYKKRDILYKDLKDSSRVLERKNEALVIKLDKRQEDLKKNEEDLALQKLIINYYKLSIHIIWLTIPQDGLAARKLFKRDTDDSDILNIIDIDLAYFNKDTTRSILVKYNLFDQHDRFIIEIDKYLGEYTRNGVKENLEFFNEKLHPKWDRIIATLNANTTDKDLYIGLNN